MATSYGALCTDFHVSQKLALKMDLPGERETVLHFFDLVRRAMPDMDRFRRYQGEMLLESARREDRSRWLSLRRTSASCGQVNPPSMSSAYELHRFLLEFAPHHLTISPLDVDYLELMFGFDLECEDNHDQVVFEALYGDTPLGEALRGDEAKILDVQPVFGMNLSEGGRTQAYVEVKTRRRSRRGSARPYRGEPISLFLTVRRYGPVDRVENLKEWLDGLAGQADALAADRVVPGLLTPIARHITSSA